MTLFQRLFGRPDDGDTDREYQLRLIRDADAEVVRQHHLRDAETYLHQQRLDTQNDIDQQRRENDAYDDNRRRDSNHRDYDSRDRDRW